ncbi:hypothetical protein LOK49_LG11G00194 [Camellia lanceoleosa]|uniref:Uncharacterized protein n=1 Tax=Camellia lanceoleosa TaxID=1840588 RepID=A0ACC0G3S9_9ERIC|nr:hypothetical protein LOK49_LG11G00194 [Camellia lanceoleosa]
MYGELALSLINNVVAISSLSSPSLISLLLIIKVSFPLMASQLDNAIKKHKEHYILGHPKFERTKHMEQSLWPEQVRLLFSLKLDDQSWILSLQLKDPQYDAMLGQMVGRIRSKPGGKLEMGEVHAQIEKYIIESSRYKERPILPGTLNVAQLRHIICLHQGKADDHNERMDFTKIANKFQIDVQIQKILQSVSLPTDDSSKERNGK